jgi:ribonuclease D
LAPGISRNFPSPLIVTPYLVTVIQPMQGISKEDLANLPIRRYEGKVSLVQTAQDLEQARADIRQERIVGLDTETRPSFKKGEVHLPCLVQAATAQAVYLFQLSRLDVFPALVELLAKPTIVKTGVGLAHDLRQLKLVFPFTVENVVDLGVIARRRGLAQTGVRNLAGMLLDFRIPKGNRTSNWAAPRLSPAQINYAATDAWASRELYLRFETLGLLSAQ